MSVSLPKCSDMRTRLLDWKRDVVVTVFMLRIGGISWTEVWLVMGWSSGSVAFVLNSTIPTLWCRVDWAGSLLS